MNKRMKFKKKIQKTKKKWKFQILNHKKMMKVKKKRTKTMML